MAWQKVEGIKKMLVLNQHEDGPLTIRKCNKGGGGEEEDSNQVIEGVG